MVRILNNNNMINNNLKMFIKGSYIISLLCKKMAIGYISIKLYIELIKGSQISFMNYILQPRLKEKCENFNMSTLQYYPTTNEMLVNFPSLIKKFNKIYYNSQT